MPDQLSMIRFRSLGAIDLHAPSGEELRSVLVGPKRVALLSYLALATPRGFHRRDVLVALLWPELDQTRARAALRYTTYHLRRALGADVVVGRGDDEVGLDWSRFWCDAAEMESLLAAGRAAEALSLYRGDLLSGLYVPRSPEFERWLDAERSRLRVAVSRAGWTASAKAEAEGRLGDAIVLARQAAASAPDDEAALRRLMALLDRGGDRAGALRAYEEFAGYLRKEFDSEPAPETVAAARAMRERVDARQLPVEVPREDVPSELEVPTAALQPVRESAAPGNSAQANDSAAAIPGERTARPSPPRLLLVAVVMLTLMLGGWAVHRTRMVVAAEASENRIAVLPFTIRGGPGIAYLGDGLVELISIKLEGAGSLRVVDPRSLLGVVSAREGVPLDPARGSALARRFAAGMFVLGSAVQAGDGLELQATLYNARGHPLNSVRVAAADEHGIFQAVDELVLRLLAGRYAGPGGMLARAAGDATRSLQALKHYLEGEEALREGRHAAAVEALRLAVDADTSFGLAWYRLGTAGYWVADARLASEGMQQAARHRDQLPPSARRLLDAAIATQEGRFAEAESLYTASIGANSDNVDAWFGLGDLHYHHNAMRGRSKGEARRSFERALALHPQHGESRLHLLELAVWEGNADEVDSLLAHLDPSSDWAAKWPLVRAIMTGEVHDPGPVVRELRATGDRALVRTLVHTAPAFPHSPHSASKVAALLTETSRAPEWRAYGYYLGAQIDLGRGRWRAAKAQLSAVRAFEEVTGLEFQALFAASSHLRFAEEDRLALRALLDQWNGSAEPSRNPVFSVHDSLHAHIRLYLLGTLSVLLDDTVSALRHASALEQLPDAPGAPQLGARLSAGVRARVAASRGDLQEALARLPDPWMPNVSPTVHRSNVFAFVHERFLRAELLSALGRDSEALHHYSAVADYSLFGMIYLAPSHLRRAEILERLGDSERARYHYAEALRLWSDADEELRPLLVGAEQFLSRTTHAEAVPRWRQIPLNGRARRAALLTPAGATGAAR